MNCRVCYQDNLETVIDLGDQYLSDFRTDDLKPKKYPLELLRCPNCHFVQLRESAPLSEMYTENYGFKSGVNNTIRADLQDIADEAMSYIGQRDNYSVLDIGSNDGTLLSFFDEKYRKVGVDPITKLCKEAEAYGTIINDFFSYDKIYDRFGSTTFDVITAISMFYDVERPEKLVREMSQLLSRYGVLTIQQNYILATLVNNAYDNICHEHIGYHSLLSMEYLLKRYGLEVVHVSTSMVNGGVLRTVIQHEGIGKPDATVQRQRDIEKEYGLDTSRPYEGFARRVKEVTYKLQDLVRSINKEGKKVYIYGASTRGGTIWQYAGLDVTDLPFAVDRNPEKVGKKIASIGVPIISEEQARKDNPEYMLVSIWFFESEVTPREKEYLSKGGHLIYPLPDLKVV